MLTEVLAILGVVLLLAGFIIIFNRRNAVGAKAFEDDELDAGEDGKTADEKDDANEENKIFASVDKSNTQDATGYAYDADGTSAVKNLSFEDKLGKDTVVVELPVPKAKKKATKPAAKPVVKKGSPVKLGATPEDLVEILEKKIAKRADVLKVAKLPESGDATLKRLRANLQKVKDKMAEAAEAKKAEKKPAKKAPSKKTVEEDVVVVKTPFVSAKKERKPARKAPAKKTTKKPTKKTTKKSK